MQPVEPRPSEAELSEAEPSEAEPSEAEPSEAEPSDIPAGSGGAHIPSVDRNRLFVSDGLSGELHLDCDFVADTAATIRAALLQETQRRLTHHRKLHTHHPDHGD